MLILVILMSPHEQFRDHYYTAYSKVDWRKHFIFTVVDIYEFILLGRPGLRHSSQHLSVARVQRK